MIGYQCIDNNISMNFQITQQVAETLLKNKIQNIKKYLKDYLSNISINKQISILCLVQQIGINQFLKSQLYNNKYCDVLQQFNKYTFTNKVKDPKKIKRRLIQYLIYTQRIKSMQQLQLRLNYGSIQ